MREQARCPHDLILSFFSLIQWLQGESAWLLSSGRARRRNRRKQSADFERLPRELIRCRAPVAVPPYACEDLGRQMCAMSNRTKEEWMATAVARSGGERREFDESLTNGDEDVGRN